MTADSIQNKYQHIVECVGRHSVRSYKFRCSFLFKGIELENTSVLDVGCGKGDLALWTALNGARYVLGIEPEAEGGTTGTYNTFKNLITDLQLSKVVNASDKYLNEINLKSLPVEGFDIAILYNVINHLDEKSVARLNYDNNAVDGYTSHIKQLHSLMNDRAIIIVADCGRRNFGDSFGMKFPMTKNINWQLHQEPEIWIKIFEMAGFSLLDLRWSPIYPFKILTSNRFINYLTISHFVLRFQK